MKIRNDHLIEILERNQHVIAAWPTEDERGERLHIIRKPIDTMEAFNLPIEISEVPRIVQTNQEFCDLRSYNYISNASYPNMRCQDEPIELGTQVQAFGANWVGTAGAPITWLDSKDRRKYGFISNWHVLIVPGQPKANTIHQPTNTNKAMGTVARFKKVSKTEINLIDAAIADSYIDGMHTTSRDIIDIGEVDSKTIDAKVEMLVMKSGRTTGLTRSTCSATGAAVKVNYGDFTATFKDQDIFDDGINEFSAPGDSGSLIVTADTDRPTALLFAGGGTMTIGNPIRYVTDTLEISFMN